MLIEHVVLENFGQHAHFECDFRAGICAIAGKNGGGKSTILSAIHFALTGESLSEGSKEDDLRFGAKKGKVTMRFSHGGTTYTVTRGLGVGAKTTLEGGGLDISKAPEANQAILDLLQTNKAVLANNVFAKQGSIDRALDHTSTERMRDLGQIFGLSGVEKLYGLLGSELSQYRLTPGLDEQLVHNLELQGTTKAELDILEAELQGCRELIQQLQGPAQAILTAAEQCTVQTRQRQQAQDTLQRAREARDTAQAAAIKAGTTLGDFLGRFTVEPTQERIEAARAHLGTLQARHHAMAEQLVRQQNLETLRQQIAATKPSEAHFLDALKDTQTTLEAKLQGAQALLEGRIDPTQHPLRDSRDALLETQRVLTILMAPQPPAELAIQAAEIRQLIDVLKAGICITCRRPLEGHTDTTHSTKERLEVLKVAYQATQASWQETLNNHVAERARLEALATTQSETLRAAEQDLKRNCQTIVERLQSELKQIKASITLEDDALRLGRERQERLAELERAIITTVDTPVTPEEIATATQSVDTAVDALATRRAHARDQEQAEQTLEKAQRDHLAALKALEAWGDIPEPPSEATLQQARQSLEQVSARTIRLQVGSREAGTLQAKLAHLDMTADQARAQLAREEKDRRWSEVLTSTRDALHISQYPAVVMREYAEALNARIAHYLRILEAPFRFWLDQSTMQFLAAFPDRQHPAARLSGAERVTASICFRLALVDTFASQLNFVALDEPSAYMDQTSIERLQGLFLSLKQLAGQSGRQIILITHESHLLNYVDHRIDVTPME